MLTQIRISASVEYNERFPPHTDVTIVHAQGSLVIAGVTIDNEVSILARHLPGEQYGTYHYLDSAAVIKWALARFLAPRIGQRYERGEQ